MVVCVDVAAAAAADIGKVKPNTTFGFFIA